MALAIGKLTILVGAGLVGSVLAKEGRMPSVSDVFSGAYKVFFKKISHDDTKSSGSKPRSDSLMAQVNSLREELQLLASNRPITIVTSAGSGSNKYGVIIVVVVLGYGYVWWKGWRLPDMMFATKRGLFDACNAVGKKLDDVHLSISKTKQHISSRIDRVDCSMDEIAEVTSATLGEVSELREDVKEKSVDVRSVHHAVQTLATKVIRFEGQQDIANASVAKLIYYADSLTTESIQAGPSSSTRPALEVPPVTPRRTASLPPIPSSEPQSPSTSNGSSKVRRPMKNAGLASGLKELNGISEPLEPSSIPSISNGNRMTEEETKSNGNSGSGLFGGRFSGLTVPFLTRSRSTVQSSK